MGAMPLGEKAKMVLPLRATTSKQQSMIVRLAAKWQARVKPVIGRIRRFECVKEKQNYSPIAFNERATSWL